MDPETKPSSSIVTLPPMVVAASILGLVVLVGLKKVNPEWSLEVWLSGRDPYDRPLHTGTSL
jgi:hypothetical protein